MIILSHIYHPGGATRAFLRRFLAMSCVMDKMFLLYAVLLEG